MIRVQYFRTGTRFEYGLENLDQCDKRVKTESQKVIGEKLLGRAQKGLNKVKRHNILKTQYEHIKMYSKKMTDGAFFPTQIDKSE